MVSAQEHYMLVVLGRNQERLLDNVEKSLRLQLEPLA
jgi:hypothetical protein